MSLTEAECKNAKCPPDKKQARFSDSGGMYLQVSPSGSKRWFLKYRTEGSEKQLALGSYPNVSLKAARQARDAAKLQKASGIDPIQAKKVEKLKAANPVGDTFKAVALEWFEKQEPHWSEAHAVRAKRQLERDLFPWLGERRLAEIEPVELLATLRKVEERGAVETADRGMMLARQVWRYGVATGRVSRDITADLKGALQPYRGKHFAAITDPVRLGELLRAIKAYKGGPIVRAALQLAPMLFQRPGELRGGDVGRNRPRGGAVDDSGSKDEAQQGWQGKWATSPCTLTHAGGANPGNSEALHRIHGAGISRGAPAGQAHF